MPQPGIGGDLVASIAMGAGHLGVRLGAAHPKPPVGTGL